MDPMSELHPADAPPSPEAARTLIAERDRLRAWLEQLDAHGTEVPEHVLERVRGDYQERLQRVTADLGEHLGSLRQSLAELRELQDAAEAQHAEARDALAEAKLRHLIGELDESAWEDRRPALEAAVTEAERESAEVGAEVARLVELVSEIEESESEATAEPVGVSEEESGALADVATEAEVAEEEEVVAAAMELEEVSEAESAGIGEGGAEEVDAAVDELFAVWGEGEDGDEKDEGEETLPWLAIEAPEAGEGIDLGFLREVSEPAAADADTAATSEGTADEALSDLAFLEELDRVIASTAPGAAQPNGAEEPAEKSGLICKECGAANDARSWYCEICGMELT